MSKSFKNGIKTTLIGLVEEKGGLSYLSWATAVALAERPKLNTVMTNGLPYRELFGGAYVTVECEGMGVQLPVLDNKNRPIHPSKMDVRDLNDTLARARAKAIAMQTGVGLALYGGYKEDANGFIRAVGAVPTSDIATIEPFEKDKGRNAAYVPWPAAWLAAKLTDESANFKVLEFENTLYSANPDTGEAVPSMHKMPALAVAGGWMVAVEITYKGDTHTELLPIMGIVTIDGKKRDHMPIVMPTVFDWNTAVMRCLAKAIAVLTGYGLSVYAGEDVADMNRAAPVKAAPAPALVEKREVEDEMTEM